MEYELKNEIEYEKDSLESEFISDISRGVLDGLLPGGTCGQIC